MDFGRDTRKPNRFIGKKKTEGERLERAKEKGEQSRGPRRKGTKSEKRSVKGRDENFEYD